jgi:hypothetical protein
MESEYKSWTQLKDQICLNIKLKTNNHPIEWKPQNLKTQKQKKCKTHINQY